MDTRDVLGARDIGAEAILLAGGARAILLQLAEPSVGRGVAEHSDFASRPLERLHGTLTYTYAVVFGTPEEVREVRHRVNRAHAPVNGTESVDAAAYDAYDPSLQLWVAATLYDTSIQVWELIFGPLDPASADRVYAEYAVIATSLQVTAELWPADRAAFADYWASVSRTLAPTPAARAVAHSLLFSTTTPLWMRALMPLVRLITAGLLPPELRLAYGMRWTPALQRRFDRWMSIFRVVYPRLPRVVRYAARDLYLRRLRRSLTGARSA